MEDKAESSVPPGPDLVAGESTDWIPVAADRHSITDHLAAAVCVSMVLSPLSYGWRFMVLCRSKQRQ